ncbi:FAD-binding protein [Streptomyces sp. NPDC057376]
MPLNLDVDVVVVGFGMAGAAASLAATRDGARVLVLDQDFLTRRRSSARRAGRSGNSALADVRASALDAGVQVRTGCRAHELVVVGGEISGVGYATLPPGGAPTAAYRWLRASGGLAPAAFSAPFTRAADAVWRSAFVVGEVTCPSVVLALDPSHWEFVGPAVWTAVRAAGRTGTRLPSRPRLRLATVGMTVAELPVRRWCAGQEAPSTCHDELRVDDRTGAVLTGEQAVPGLYSAVRVAAASTGSAFRAGQCAGRGAADAAGRHGGAALLSVV